MVTVRLARDEVTPHLRKLLQMAASNGSLATVMGRAGANELKKHFRTRNGNSANKLGGKRTNFWSAVAASVSSPRQEPGRIVIPVTHPAIAQKVYGGTIRARRTKNLAIPIDAKAHGKSPRVFTALEFAMTRRGTKLLGLRNAAGGMDWLYVLKPSVKQARDPLALPATGQMEPALRRAAEIYLRGV